MSNPEDTDQPREVLSSLPRSRRQRPSARREAARAGRAAPAKPKPTATKATAVKAKPAPKPTATKPKPRKKPVPVAQARPTSAAKTSVIPPAGYATPREGRGSADPAEALLSLARGIRGLLPF